MAVTVARNVSQSITETVLIRDVSQDMVLLEPDISPLLVMTNNAKRKRPSTSPRFEWVEDQEVSLWGQVSNSTDYAAASTGIIVADISIFATNDLIAFPKADSSSAAEEVCLVTALSGVAVGTGTLTITRAIGGAGGDTITATQSVRILGGAFTENSAIPIGRYTTKSVKISYCQIFRTIVDVSNTQRSTDLYAAQGGEAKYQLAKALIRHRCEIEAAGLWSRASESLATPTSRWTTMGFKPTVTTNVTDVSTTLTLTKFNTFSETAFRFGETSKLFIAAPKVISALNSFSQSRLFTANDDKVFGVRIQKFRTPHGDLMLARNFRMEAGISGASGFNDEAYAIDLPSVEMRFLSGNGNSRDTKLISNLVQDGTDGQKDQYLSQVGWAIRQEKKHSRLFNVSAYS